MTPKRRWIFQVIPRQDVTDFLFEEKFKILGCTMNRQGKTHECLEERMQSANKKCEDLQKQRRTVENQVRKNGGTRMDFEGEKAHQICSFMWVDNFWIMSHSEKNLEQMLRNMIEKVSRWDLVPKTASL